LGNDIRLHITIVVLAGPYESTIGLDGVSNKIVDESVLVPELLLLELSFVCALVELSEDVFEATIVLLEDSVLCGEVEGVVALKGKLEARVAKLIDRFISVVHGEHNTGSLELEDFHIDGLTAVLRSEGHSESTGLLGDIVGSAVLVTKCVSTNNDGLGPSRNAPRDVFDDDGLTEYGTAKDVTDGAVGGLPHLLKFEFFNTLFIRGDGGALDTNLAGLDGSGAVVGDFVICGITVFHAQIEVLAVEVQVGEDKLSHILA
jgi:hypothetical protein